MPNDDNDQVFHNIGSLSNLMTFTEKAKVIAELWIEFRNDEDFEDFMSYNDIGCPLAYMYANGLATDLSTEAIQMVSETFDMFMNMIKVSEYEIADVLPEKNLGAILMFSHMKSNSGNNESNSSEGNLAGSAPSTPTFDTVNPNRGSNFSHYAHAFNALFGTKFHTVGEISAVSEANGDELLRLASQGDPEAILKVSVIYCTQEGNFTKAHSTAKLALDNAMSSSLDLGRYWFGYGFALEQVEMFDDAIDAHETALGLGFGPAAFNFGRIMLSENLDLGGAVRAWKIGRDKYFDYVCKEMIEDLETEPGVYRATVNTADGGAEILIASDKPGGLGTFN